MSLNIIFAGTPQFAVPIFQALIKSKHKVIAVYTRPDRPTGRGQKMTRSAIKTLALSQKIMLCEPLSFRKEEEQKIMTLKADIMVVVAYGLLLPRSVLAAYRFGCINLHPSLLPRWRGAAPVQHAILAGDKETGITIIKMDEKLDTGNILTQRACFIMEKDTTNDLYEKLSFLGADLLIETLDKIELGTAQIKRQDAGHATYAKKIKKEDANLDWHKPATDLVRQVRAYNPAPVAFTYFKNRFIRIWQAEVIPEKTQLKAGSLVRLEKNGLDVATGDGVLRLCRLQLPGKRIQLVGDFINAYRKDLIPGQIIFG